MAISRRYFLKSGGLSLFGASFVPTFLRRTAYALEQPRSSARKKILVAIFQRGAADGLNIVVPFGDKPYYSLRPSIAIPEPTSRTESAGQSAIDLDGFFGLHPSLEFAEATVRRAPTGHRPCGRIARQHAIALRRAGLHGDGNARPHGDARRLAESLSRDASRGRGHSVPRRGLLAAHAAHVARCGAGPCARRCEGLPLAGRGGHGRALGAAGRIRGHVRLRIRCPARSHRAGDVRGRGDPGAASARTITSRRTARNIPRVRSARACSRWRN